MSDDQRKKLSPTVLLVVVIAAIGLGCHWAGTGFIQSRTQESVEPHGTFPGDCGLCHVGQGWNDIRPVVSFDHEEETGHRLEGAHAGAGCLACHNDRGPVTTYIARGCGGCHPDPHASVLGSACQKCHSQTDWKRTGSVAESVETRFHAIPAHSVPPCQHCHVSPTGVISQQAPTQCRLCHQTGSVQP